MLARARRNRFRCTDSKIIMFLTVLFFFCGTAVLQTALTNITGDPFPDSLRRRGDEEWQNYHRHLQGNNTADQREELVKNKIKEFPYCVAVLTGFPEKAKSAGLAVRLVKQLLGSLSVHEQQLEIYCQGTGCYRQMISKLGNGTGLTEDNFHDLNNQVNKTIYKGFIITENYRLMLQDLLNAKTYKYCVILEDDLVLSQDALYYLNIGKTMMERDESIFAVSLYNDNSFPWCASNPDFFRRTEQFSGLGFITSRNVYQKFIHPNWRTDITWDALFQSIVSEYKMVSIQPEMSRVMHTRDPKIKKASEKRLVHTKYEAQAVYTGSILRNGYHQLSDTEEGKYDAFIRHFVPSARVVHQIEDAGFAAKGIDLVLPSFDKNNTIRGALDRMKLVSVGLGGLIRGIYKGSLFLRINGNLLLLLSRDSPFYSPFLNSKLQELDLDAKLSEASSLMMADKPRVASESLGTFYNLKTNYLLTVGNSSKSCYQTCKSKNKNCDISALWQMNRDCSILRQLFADCVTCAENPREPLTIKGNSCAIGYSFYLSCISMYESKDTLQLCACR